jgi:hypothetical protein
MSDQQKVIADIAADIVSRRQSYFVGFDGLGLSADQLAAVKEISGRFARDAAIEALHSNDAYLTWYSRAKAAESQLAELGNHRAGQSAFVPKPPKF